jgi:hypothetical protein
MTTNNGQLQTVYYPTEKLIFAEYNPRQLTKDQYKALRDSIERFGLVDPIIVNKHKDRKNIVVGGHQRIRIAQDLGIKDIPCVEVELDADREKELNVRLNRNTGEWDWDALANCFDVGELSDWGFSDKELLGDTKNSETEPEIEITPELFESHNYLVLYFDNDFDWQTAVDVFGIAKTMRKNTKIGDIGEGRVLSGATVLKAIL